MGSTHLDDVGEGQCKTEIEDETQESGMNVPEGSTECPSVTYSASSSYVSNT
jgi:hypothetical protein